MSIPSVETDNTSSTTIDDDMSVIVHDLSDTTVTTQMSTSWHSVVSDVHINTNLLLRPYSINIWLKICIIEPDIRLTTAQEWKLRTCMRRLLSLCNLPLKISCRQTKEFILISNENQIIPFIDQEQQSTPMINPSLINHSWLNEDQILYDQLQQLGLYLHILPSADTNNGLLEVKLFEFYTKKSLNTTINHISLIKSPRFVFHISSNILLLSLRSTNSLLELKFSTRENEAIQGSYYQWNKIKNEHNRFDITVAIDQSLINEFNTI